MHQGQWSQWSRVILLINDSEVSLPLQKEAAYSEICSNLRIKLVNYVVNQINLMQSQNSDRDFDEATFNEKYQIHRNWRETVSTKDRLIRIFQQMIGFDQNLYLPTLVEKL